MKKIKMKKTKVKEKYISRKELTCYIGWMQGFIYANDNHDEALEILRDILKVMKYEKPKN